MATPSHLPSNPSVSGLLFPPNSTDRRPSMNTAPQLPLAGTPSKRSHRRQNRPIVSPEPSPHSSSRISAHYNEFWAKDLSPAALKFPSSLPRPISDLLQERREKFKSPEFIFQPTVPFSTSTPLCRSHSHSSLHGYTQSIETPPILSFPNAEKSSSASYIPPIASLSLTNTSLSINFTMVLLDAIERDAPLRPSLPPHAPHDPISPPDPSPTPRCSRSQRISAILDSLHDIRLSPATLLLEVLANENHYAAKFFGNSGVAMIKILDAMVGDERGERIFRQWVTPKAIDIACEVVSVQMDGTVKALSTAPSVTKLTPQFLRAWSLKKNVVDPAETIASDVVKILDSAINSRQAVVKNKKKSSDTVCAVFNHRATGFSTLQNCSDFSGPMTLFWWKNGCTRESLEVLQNLGLSKCFDSALAMVGSVADYCIEDARVAAKSPDGFMGNWDNINISTSDFVEQRTGGPAKVSSGTYAIIYALQNPNPKSMSLAPLLVRADSAPDLDFNADVCPMLEQSISAYHNFRAYTTGFEYADKIPALQSIPRRPLPEGYKTKQYPIRLSTIEENSISGNLAVHQDVFSSAAMRY
ncbi:hypothetical protein K438DRAFT_1748526 [Mycena galopus ATCC 62051]|nr:hypothetical protein K438DRAFT_1748526 [Mycena galopus ATCC 62051]